MRRPLILFFAVLLAALPSAAVAQEGDEPAGLALRVDGDLTLAAGDAVRAFIVVNGDATIAGTVDGLVLVINGDATVSGTTDGDITIVNGTLTLESTAVVNNISLVRSELVEEPGAQVRGDVTRTTRWVVASTGAIILFGFVFWIAMTIAVFAAGVVFAAVGGRQLVTATQLMEGRAGQSILSGIILFFALPIVAVLAMLTIVGIPLGLGMLLFLLPTLTFLGYIVAGAWLGSLMLRRTPVGQRGTHPYAQVIAGLLVFQLVILIPGIAPILFIIGGIWGAGGLMYMAFRNLRGSDNGSGDTTPHETAPPAPQPTP